MLYITFRSFVIAAALSASLGAVAHAPAVSSGPCPAESARAAEVMDWFLGTAEEPMYKAEVGLTGVGPGDARLLRSETDAAACEALNGEFVRTIAEELDGQRTNDLAYYDLGGRYIAVTTFRPLVNSEYVVIGLENLFTFDRSFAYLDGLGF